MRNLSIRAKLTILFVVLFLILSSTFSFFMYLYLSRILYLSEEDIIMDEIEHIQSHLTTTYDPQDNSFDYSQLGLLSQKTGINILGPQGDIAYGPTDSGITDLPIEGGIFREFNSREYGEWIFYDDPIFYKDEIKAWLRVSRSVSHIMDTLANIRTVIFTATPIYVFLATLSSLFLTNRALSPIDSITKTASMIEKGELSQRLDTPRVNDEVGRLVRTFNKMLERIETLFKKEKRFTSDASHELKTPISVISATAQEALKNGSTKEDLKDALKNIIGESKNLGYLISQLLFLARSDEGKEVLNLEEIDLVLTAESVVGQLSESAEKKNIRILIDLKQDFRIKADQTLVTMLFLNIIENSIKYNKYGGYVNISLLKKKNEVVIIFEDNGIGIAEEDLPYIFDRFYQVSRSRTGKGSGLGLSITKEIVEVHNGRININSRFGKGTRIEVMLPYNQF